jgi:hypothetical protein
MRHAIDSPSESQIPGRAAHVNRPRLAPPRTEPKRMAKQRAGLTGNGRCAPLRSRRTTVVIPEHPPEAHPMSVP